MADIAPVLVTNKELLNPPCISVSSKKILLLRLPYEEKTVTMLMVPNNHIFEVAYLNALASPHAVNEIVFQGLYFQLMPLKCSRGFKEKPVHCGQY